MGACISADDSTFYAWGNRTLTIEPALENREIHGVRPPYSGFQVAGRHQARGGDHYHEQQQQCDLPRVGAQETGSSI